MDRGVPLCYAARCRDEMRCARDLLGEMLIIRRKG